MKTYKETLEEMSKEISPIIVDGVTYQPICSADSDYRDFWDAGQNKNKTMYFFTIDAVRVDAIPDKNNCVALYRYKKYVPQNLAASKSISWENPDDVIKIGEWNFAQRRVIIDYAAQIIFDRYYDTAVGLMDDEIREELHFGLAPCTDLEFLQAYIGKHREKYGTDFEI